METFEDAYSAAKGSHALCILTEWDEFKELDFQVLHLRRTLSLLTWSSCLVTHVCAAWLRHEFVASAMQG